MHCPVTPCASQGPHPREGGRSRCQTRAPRPGEAEERYKQTLWTKVRSIHSLREVLGAGFPALHILGTRLQSLLLHLVPGGARATCAPWQVAEQAMGTVWRCCWLCEAAPLIFSSPWVFQRLLGLKRTPSPQSWSSQRKKIYSPGPHAAGTIALPTSRVLLCPSICHRVPCHRTQVQCLAQDRGSHCSVGLSVMNGTFTLDPSTRHVVAAQ